MRNVEKFTNPAEQTVNNYMQAVNAYSDHLSKSGEGKSAEYLNVGDAKNTYGQMLKLVTAFANPSNPKHNQAYNTVKEQLGNSREAINDLRLSGERVVSNIRQLATVYNQNGFTPEEAKIEAFNSMMGNPVYDHFGNLNLLAGQLYQEKTFIQSFISKGDAFSVPVEGGEGVGGTAISRFRVPVEKVVGSAKVYQGDINPQSQMQVDSNRIQHTLTNEFKNADTLVANFSITQDQRNQALGYQRAVAPALAGFILQQRYFQSSQEQVLKLAEVRFADGQNPAGNYTPNVGGSYGILSSNILLALADSGNEAPQPASSSDWLGNPTKLIQKIDNFYAKPTSTTAPLPAALGTTNLYKDLVRLFSLPATQNVEFSGNGEWTLYVPTSWYSIAVQYPTSGTFNKQLQEMVKDAVGDKIVKSIEVLPSSLLDYRAANSYGVAQNNLMVAVAHGAQTEKKPCIMPGETALPVVSSENVSSQIMNFSTMYTFGGPMVTQYGGVFVLDFSVAA